MKPWLDNGLPTLFNVKQLHMELVCNSNVSLMKISYWWSYQKFQGRKHNAKNDFSI